MAREIKFRALYKGKWYYSDSYSCAKALGVKLGESITRKFWSMFTGHKTLTQYTCAYDKEGYEIFEGDILQISADNFDTKNAGHEVVFGNHCIGKDDWGLEHKTPGFVVKFKDGSGYCGIPDECIVIGNIFQNPELIKP